MILYTNFCEEGYDNSLNHAPYSYLKNLKKNTRDFKPRFRQSYHQYNYHQIQAQNRVQAVPH